MTQEIIEMARESGMELYGLGKDRARFVHHLEAFAKLVAEAEREACAEVCNTMARRTNDIRSAALESAAENILARGQA